MSVLTLRKLIPYGEDAILLSNNRIEHCHSEIAPNIRCMRDVKNLERENKFLHAYNFVHDFLRKGRLKRFLGQLGLELSLKGLMKLFYMVKDF